MTHAPYGVCRCDSTGILLDVNPALVRMLGYDSGATLVGSNLANLYSDSQQWFLPRGLSALAGRNSRPDRGLGAQGRNFHQRPALRTRLSAATETRLFFELFAEDVTERRALEQQLRQAQKMEAVGRLAGGIAHDFNNLLMVISGYSEFLLERIGREPTLRGPAQEIANAAERATSLTRQLLAFSRKQMLAPKVVDLNGVVTENLKMLTRLIGEDIDLVMVPGTGYGRGESRSRTNRAGHHESCGQCPRRDAARRQAHHRDRQRHAGRDYARFHAPVKPGRVRDARHQRHRHGHGRRDPDSYLRALLHHQGLERDRAWAFRRFTASSSKVKATSGCIARPAKAQLSRFICHASSATGETICAADGDCARWTGTRNHSAGRGRRESAPAGAAILENQGYTVIEAADGAAAIDISQAHHRPHSSAVTDVIMPGMNGRELANQLSPTRPETKVLYMSGYTENHIGHNGTLDKGITLLQKPFTLPALKAKVREVLDTPLPKEMHMSARLAHSVPMTRTRNKISSPFRATRFDLHLPLKYRLVGENGWRREQPKTSAARECSSRRKT